MKKCDCQNEMGDVTFFAEMAKLAGEMSVSQLQSLDALTSLCEEGTARALASIFVVGLRLHLSKSTKAEDINKIAHELVDEIDKHIAVIVNHEKKEYEVAGPVSNHSH